MNYKKAVQYIIDRYNNEKVQAQIYYDNLLKTDSKLAKLENDIRLATLEYVKTNDDKKLNELTKKKNSYIKSLNIPPQKISPTPHCKKCGDSGFINGKFCDCVKNLAITIDGNNISLPIQDFVDIDMKLFENEDKQKIDNIVYNLKGFCERFPNTKKHTICLVGGAGTGKTFLAGCVCNELLQKNASVIFITAFELVKMCLDYHINTANSYENMDKLLDCDFLAIDDLGTESIYKNVTLEYLYQIINERQIHNKFTLITSNLNMDEISLRYGERIASRLFDGKQSYFKEFNISDIRKFKIN